MNWNTEERNLGEKWDEMGRIRGMERKLKSGCIENKNINNNKNTCETKPKH